MPATERRRYPTDIETALSRPAGQNDFFKQVEEAESRGATTDELRTLLGKGRAKKGIFEGDLFEGELEIGQVASCIHKLQTVDEVMKDWWKISMPH